MIIQLVVRRHGSLFGRPVVPGDVVVYHRSHPGRVAIVAQCDLNQQELLEGILDGDLSLLSPRSRAAAVLPIAAGQYPPRQGLRLLSRRVPRE